jgi:beta-glucosidase
MSRIVPRMRAAAIAVALLSLTGAVGQDAAPVPPLQEAPADALYRDPSQPVGKRVDDLIARMTTEEKVSQLVNQARAIPRLGVPAYNWWSEALHGVARNGHATVFPEPIGLAAAFDPALVHDMGVAISTEARVKFNQAGPATADHFIYQGLDFWSPNINIFRDPRWGRGQETYGEDPYLTGRMGVAFITGMQGDDPRYYRTIATAKHFAVHSGPEPSRHAVDVPVSRHDEADTYLPAFRAAVIEGRADSVMCAYNRVNGQPACASDFLLNDMLRGAWKFDGYVVSDCDAIADIQRGHRFTESLAEAAAVSLKHGVDNDCADFGSPTGRGTDDYDRYAAALSLNLLTTAQIDATLRRLFTARMRLGLFDPPSMVPYAQIPDSELHSPAHRALALKAAAESMVLLKNNGVLPLPAKIRRIAVIGPLADQVDVLNGNYNGVPIDPVTVLDGLRKAFPHAEIVFEPGTNFLRAATPVPAEALTTPDGRPGLAADFYRVADFLGDPALHRVDSVVNYTRDMAPVLPGDYPFSARWTGFVTFPDGGTWRIGVDGRNSKLWIDGALAVDNSDPRQRGPKTADLKFDAGRKYAIRIEQTPARGPVLRFVWTRIVDKPLERAIAAARGADVVIAVAGITSSLEGEEMTVNVPGFEGGDRTSLDMPKDEEDLLKAVKGTGKKMVLVLMNGSALSVNWAAKNADAILDAWYPGEQGGTAVANTLSGANNPSGRLPVTFYTGVDQLPPFDDYAMANRTYRYFTGKPLYSFGYGLSYTHFAFAPLKLSAARLKAGDTLSVDGTVRNTGTRAGDEAVQLYLTFPKLPGAPLRALRALTRVSLKPGESKPVHFALSPRDLSMVDPDGRRLVAAGAYRLTVGGGQPGTGASGASAALTIVGDAPLPD